MQICTDSQNNFQPKSPTVHFCSIEPVPKLRSSLLIKRNLSFPNRAASFQVVSCCELSPARICVSVSGSVSDRAHSLELFTITAFTLCFYRCGESHWVAHKEPTRASREPWEQRIDMHVHLISFNISKSVQQFGLENVKTRQGLRQKWWSRIFCELSKEKNFIKNLHASAGRLQREQPWWGSSSTTEWLTNWLSHTHARAHTHAHAFKHSPLFPCGILLSTPPYTCTALFCLSQFPTLVSVSC